MYCTYGTQKMQKMDRWILLWRSCPIWKRWRSLPSSEAINLGQGKDGKPRGESSLKAVKAKRGRGQWKVGSKKHVPSLAVRMFSCKSPDVQLSESDQSEGQQTRECIVYWGYESARQILHLPKHTHPNLFSNDPWVYQSMYKSMRSYLSKTKKIPEIGIFQAAPESVDNAAMDKRKKISRVLKRVSTAKLEAEMEAPRRKKWSNDALSIWPSRESVWVAFFEAQMFYGNKSHLYVTQIRRRWIQQIQLVTKRDKQHGFQISNRSVITCSSMTFLKHNGSAT